MTFCVGNVVINFKKIFFIYISFMRIKESYYRDHPISNQNKECPAFLNAI